MTTYKQSFVLNTVRQATGIADFLVRFPPFVSGASLTIEAFSATNLTTDAKTVHVGAKRAEDEIYLETLTLTTHANYYKSQGPITVPSDWIPIFKVVSPTAGDKYILNVFGYLEIPTP